MGVTTDLGEGDVGRVRQRLDTITQRLTGQPHLQKFYSEAFCYEWHLYAAVPIFGRAMVGGYFGPPNALAGVVTMPMRTNLAIAPLHASPPIPYQPPERWFDLLYDLGAMEDEEHVIVLGKDGPDLMCALLRAGARKVTHYRSQERLEARSASLIIVPRTASIPWLHSALPSIRRALITNGRLVVVADPIPSTQNRIRSLLKLHAFAATRAFEQAGRHVLGAEVPSYGHRLV
jgi:hypothetical protein